MPAVVPTYDIPQVTPGALPAARQTTPDRLMAANSIGAEQQVKMGAAAQQFANTLNDIDVAHQIQVNENKAKDADTAYMTGANAILHGTPDGNGNPSPNAYLTKMGGDAVDSFDATTKALNDLKQKALDGLDNDAQRAAAKHVLETRYEAFATKAAAHKDQQLKVYGIASATSRADAASDSAKTLYNPITDHPVLADQSGEVVAGFQRDTNPDKSTWGKRPDGSEKGAGYLGVLKRPDGGVSSEISIGVEINGKEVEVPSMVPTLNATEIKWLMTHDPSDRKEQMPDSIVEKATKFAEDRIAQGKDPLAGKDDTPVGATQNAASPYQQNLRTAKVEANHIVDLQYGVNAAPDVRAQMVKAHMEKVYVGIIGHLYESGKAGDGSTQIAKGYFDQVKSELSPAVRDDIQGKLHAAATQDRVLTYSDHLFDTVRGENAQKSQVRKDFEAGKIDGVERERIESRIEHYAAKQRDAADRHTANIDGQMQDFFIKHPGTTVDDLPRPIYAALKDKGGLARAVSFSGAISRGEGKNGDPVLFMNLHEKAARGELTQLDVVQSRGKVSESQFNDLLGTYNGMTKQDTKRMQSDAMINRSLKLNTVTEFVRAAGIDLSPKEGSSAAMETAKFLAAAREAVQAAQQDNPRLTQADSDKIVRGLVSDQVLSGSGIGSWFKTHVRPYQMTPEQRAQGFEIDKANQSRIATRLKAAGKSPTPENIQRYYKIEQGL